MSRNADEPACEKAVADGARISVDFQRSPTTLLDTPNIVWDVPRIRGTSIDPTW